MYAEDQVTLIIDNTWELYEKALEVSKGAQEEVAKRLEAMVATSTNHFLREALKDTEVDEEYWRWLASHYLNKIAEGC